MSDTVVLRSATDTPTEDAVVTVQESPVGAHTGLSYRVDDKGARRHLHLAWHHRLRDDPEPPSEGLWVEPRLDEYALSDVRVSARLIARRHADGLLPYAFRFGARFDAMGALQLNQGHGLTCSTFVIEVLAHAGVNLVDAATWEQDRPAPRRQEDEDAQRRLVAYLRKMPDARRHADLVEAEVPCTRIRAEEVAAASGMDGLPVCFLRAEPQGRRVLDALREDGPTGT